MAISSVFSIRPGPDARGWRRLRALLGWAGAFAAAATFRGETTRPLAPVPAAGVRPAAAPADPDHFMFIVGGDNRAVTRHAPLPPSVAQIFSEMRLLRPAFALWTGDAIYGSEETVGEADAEYDDFLAAVARALTPIYNAVGNHELFNRPEMAALYEKRMGRLYGSFDCGDTHCIALDTEPIGKPPGVTGEERAWLERDLEANRGAARIFVFSHHALFPKKANSGFPSRANRDDLHRLFVQHQVKAVFSGHEHLYHQSVHDGILYVVTGGAGAPTASPDEGGFQHYVLVTVNGGEITTAPIEPWRLFLQVGAAKPDGSCSAQIWNYDNQDFSVYVDFPTGARAAVSAYFDYHGVHHALDAAIVPSRHAGMTTARVTVPRATGVQVLLRPASARPATTAAGVADPGSRL